MHPLENAVKTLVRYMYYVAGAALVLMMVLTCVDIVLRLAVTLYAKYDWTFIEHLQPIPGTYELVCFLGSTAAAFAMAHTLVESGHVAVSVLVRLFSQRVQAIFQVVTSSMAFIFFGLLSWQSIVYAQKLKRWGEVSMTLELPYYPFVYGLGFAAAAVCLVLLMTVIDEGRKVVDK
ncbi:MAG: TRAP transporter small permease [Deltaproteobacteria bacterium]|jgi:TRAP-type C4-dicarboxylate transport system permease small subunit